MKLTYKQSEHRPDRAFLARQDTLPCIEQDWHFHPELELIYFLKSTGTRYVGNSIGNFAPGELYLIGSELPHLFRNDKKYYQDKEEMEAVDLIVVKFERDFLGKDFFSLAESRRVMFLFEKANRGLKFSKAATYLVHNQLVGLVGSGGLASVIGLLRILDILSVSENHVMLCPEDVGKRYKGHEHSRMAEIINFLTENFDKKISLQDVADVAHMTPNSFCRYFKNQTSRSFSQYLNEIRIRHACKLLIEGGHQVSDVCYQSGFNTFTNFNRQFKTLMQLTPTEYLRQYRPEPGPVSG